MKTESGPVFRLDEYRPTDFEIDTVALTFRLEPTDTLVTSTLSVKRRNGVSHEAPLILDGDELVFAGVELDGQSVDTERYDADPDRLEIRQLPAADRFFVTVKTRISPESNTKLMGLYRSSGNYCTQCEAEGFRRITYFLDRPDVLAVYTTRLEAKRSEAPLLLSNGNPTDAGDLEDGWHFAEWHDPHPKPSYLFALVAGDLGVIEQDFTTRSGRPVNLKIFVEHGKEPLAAYAMDALVRSMRWDEDTFGREYDLDVFMIVAVSDFNMGAMENKGLNIFNDKYVLADPQSATDADYANIEAIIAHEYFHNWTGNRITCRDWFQLCLKEGLTVYRDHEFSADMRSRAVKRIAEVRLLKAHQFPEDSGPLAHPVRPVQYSEINNFYTATVYEKGSEVVGMLATILGPTDFKKGLDLYFDRHDGDAATVEDFLACFEDAAEIDLTQFSTWYHQAGTPAVTIATRYDRRDKALVVNLEQSVSPTPGQSKKKLMHIPLRVGLFDGTGGEITASAVTGINMTGDVLHLTKRRHQVTFSGLAGKPILSVNRNFSAPVNIQFQQASADLAHLARHETEPYSRWQALNELAIRELIGATDTTHSAPASRDSLLKDCLLATVADDTLEPALRAQGLSLPSESDIAREIGSNIDPDVIHTARKAVIGSIARSGVAVFGRTVDTFRPAGGYTPDAQSAGRRALYVAGLLYQAIGLEDPDEVLVAYRNADNMTVLSATLSILAHQFTEHSGTIAALEDFRRRYQDNPLILDKWFAVQATIPGRKTLDRVKNLMDSDHFQATNPNRIRALIGSFVTGNPSGFNDIDGHGYSFLAEQVIRLDNSNPQVAARLLTAMRSWQSLEPVRRKQAGTALQTIVDQRGLSTDVRDIAERSLR
ncbi:MAG: aminopeptidase N [Alphaproteobacteria bacterium]|nr:aminopeptidase N [Alphaproteobacteria bacterium]